MAALRMAAWLVREKMATVNVATVVARAQISRHLSIAYFLSHSKFDGCLDNFIGIKKIKKAYIKSEQTLYFCCFPLT